MGVYLMNSASLRVWSPMEPGVADVTLAPISCCAQSQRMREAIVSNTPEHCRRDAQGFKTKLGHVHQYAEVERECGRLHRDVRRALKEKTKNLVHCRMPSQT